MGDVYLADDTTLQRRVALKLLPAEFTDDDRIQRFKREATAASRLNHPNILTVHEAGSHDGQHFIATEFVDGRTLREMLRQDGRLPVADTLAIAAQVASALAAAHAAGIVHRDVKPENIMVRPDGYVKVLDFGIAKLMPELSPAPDARTTAVQLQTEAGVVFGTAQYMSPEQARGLPVDARTDVWSLGCVIYEMLSGVSPFARASAADTLVAIVEREPTPVRTIAPDSPGEIDWILSKALQKNLPERYQTADDFAADLRRLQKGLEVASHLERVGTPSPAIAASSSIPATSRRRLRTAVRSSSALIVAAVVLSAAVAGAWYRYEYTAAASAPIRTLAVLPLRSLADQDDYLGLGIADAVIRKTSQSADVIVRPTSAIRRYVDQEPDVLTAARELNAEAILEGTVQRADDRLRVSVNLLRAADGASLWADSFDLRMSDIFAVQDTVAQQVAAHLKLRLNGSAQAPLARRPTANALAYDFYLKGLYNFDQRLSQNSPQSDVTIGFFTQSIAADPNFALAHAALAYAFAIKAVFTDPTQTVWAERAREEIARAEALDPHMVDTALARFQLLSSRYGNFDFEAAVRVIRTAQQTNPNIGHGELAYLYTHLGLADMAERAAQRALEVDPTSDFAKGQLLGAYESAARYDDWLAAFRRFTPAAPIEPWYFLATGRLGDAQRAMDAPTATDTFGVSQLQPSRALLAAMNGDIQSAEAAVPAILSRHPVKDPFYHHDAYAIAQIYALAGDRAQAMSWLKEASACGYSPYLLFEHDTALDSLRRSREFIEFMRERKLTLDRARREFS